MMGFFMFVIVVALGVLALTAGLQLLGDRRRTLEGAGPSTDRMDRMESALGALESRLDDLQEQQRFLERLLAERPERPSLPRRDEEEQAEEGSDSILFDTEASEDR